MLHASVGFGILTMYFLFYSVKRELREVAQDIR